MEHITSGHLLSLFEPGDIIEIVRQGILDYADGKYSVPERMHINREDSTTLIMPAFGPKYNCTKLISVNPQNSQRKLPIINGLLVLNNNEVGMTVATMDAPMITALRTAAVGSLGMQLIWDKKSVKLGVIGLGIQGLWQTIFAASDMEINEFFCYTRTENKFALYKKEIERRFAHIKIVYCQTAHEVVKCSQVILACTTSEDPVFKYKDIDISEKRFISVGSFKKSMQELPDNVYKNADALIIDSKHAKNEVGDVINTIKHNWIPESHIFTLSDILSKKISLSGFKNIVFKSVGMAAFDLVLATAIYEKVIKSKNSI